MEKAATKQKPKAKKLSKAEQHERFVATAREFGVDESGETFERAFAKIVPPKISVRRPKSP